MLYAHAMTSPNTGLQREVFRLFEDALLRGHAGRNEWTPAVDIRETDDELTFAIELAGTEPNDVQVTTENGVLTVSGERNEQWKDEGRYHLVERGYGSFVRRFQLPAGVDTDKIQADVTNGLVQVRIPKSALPQPKTIQVTVGADALHRTQPAIGRDQSQKDSLLAAKA